MKSARWSARLFPFFVSAHALAQVFLCAHAFAREPGSEEAASSSLDTASLDPKRAAEAHELDTAAGSSAANAGSARPGFEAGVRVGAALPIGKAGRDADGADRKLGELTSWRTPLWLDVSYRVSPGASYGVYGQLGVGGTGGGCNGKCDFSDLRIGVQGQWRFNPESKLNPWLGLGAGWESLSYRTLELETGGQSTELLAGPELLLQGGLELRVERALRIGPFVSAGVGNYIRDSYKCAPEGADCPTGSSVAGSGFHTWLGFGLSARYSP